MNANCVTGFGAARADHDGRHAGAPFSLRRRLVVAEHIVVAKYRQIRKPSRPVGRLIVDKHESLSLLFAINCSDDILAKWRVLPDCECIADECDGRIRCKSVESFDAGLASESVVAKHVAAPLLRLKFDVIREITVFNHAIDGAG